MRRLIAELRLIAAELRKLNRPMTWAVTICAALLGVLLVWAEVFDVSLHPALQVGPHLMARADVAAHLQPLAVGAIAGGLMASLPGAMLIALLAGGHVGGEWSGRTIKTLVTQHGWRPGILAAKAITLWIAGVGMTVACWIALAVAGPVLAGYYQLPSPDQTVSAAAGLGFSQSARALLVLGAFAFLGVLAAVLTRSLVGTVATVMGAVAGMLLLAGQPAVGAISPANWVQGWMGYSPIRQTIVSHYWSVFSYPNQINPALPGTIPTHQEGLIGLLCLLAFCAIAAVAWFRRSDITV